MSALILAHIKKIAEAFLQKPIDAAVISVPAYYSDAQRQAVREAGRLAGFDVKRIVNEPTAAALAYGFSRGLDQKILVYDLGGGTFDVSVLQLTGNVFEVLATGGRHLPRRRGLRQPDHRLGARGLLAEAADRPRAVPDRHAAREDAGRRTPRST